jgi:hypothetical protein
MRIGRCGFHSSAATGASPSSATVAAAATAQGLRMLAVETARKVPDRADRIRKNAVMYIIWLFKNI